MNSAPVEVFFEFFSPSEAMCVSIPSATQMIIIVVSIIISTIRIVIRNEILFIDRRNVMLSVWFAGFIVLFLQNIEARRQYRLRANTVLLGYVLGPSQHCRIQQLFPVALLPCSVSLQPNRSGAVCLDPVGV
jgi:hypothetical protein